MNCGKGYNKTSDGQCVGKQPILRNANAPGNACYKKSEADICDILGMF